MKDIMSKYKGMTFAQAAKKIDSKYKGWETDSLKGKAREQELKKLSEANDKARAIEMYKQQANNDMNTAANNVSVNGSVFNYGGILNKYKYGGKTKEYAAAGINLDPEAMAKAASKDPKTASGQMDIIGNIANTVSDAYDKKQEFDASLLNLSAIGIKGKPEESKSSGGMDYTTFKDKFGSMVTGEEKKMSDDTPGATSSIGGDTFLEKLRSKGKQKAEQFKKYANDNAYAPLTIGKAMEMAGTIPMLKRSKYQQYGNAEEGNIKKMLDKRIDSGQQMAEATAAANASRANVRNSSAQTQLANTSNIMGAEAESKRKIAAGVENQNINLDFQKAGMYRQLGAEKSQAMNQANVMNNNARQKQREDIQNYMSEFGEIAKTLTEFRVDDINNKISTSLVNKLAKDFGMSEDMAERLRKGTFTDEDWDSYIKMKKQHDDALAFKEKKQKESKTNSN